MLTCSSMIFIIFLHNFKPVFTISVQLRGGKHSLKKFAKAMWTKLIMGFASSDSATKATYLLLRVFSTRCTCTQLEACCHYVHQNVSLQLLHTTHHYINMIHNMHVKWSSKSAYLLWNMSLITGNLYSTYTRLHGSVNIQCLQSWAPGPEHGPDVF
jgi:hypothetical protein